MRAAALLLVVSSSAHAGFGWLAERGYVGGGGGVGQSFSLPAGSDLLLQFAPASGLGLQSAADLCDTYSADFTGNYFCLRGDGTQLAGGFTMTAQGTPTAQVLATCPNGLDCTATTGMRLNGTTDYYKSANRAAPTGDFTACFFGMLDSVLDQFPIEKFGFGAGEAGLRMETAGNGTANPIVYKTDGSASSTLTYILPSGTDLLYCAVYDFITDGTSTLTTYINGSSANITQTTTAVGPMQATAGVPWMVGARGNPPGAGNFTKGRMRNAFMVETALSASKISAMARTALADRPTGTLGEALTFSRTSMKFCSKSTGAEGSWVSGGSGSIPYQPCIAGGGIHIEGANTNLAVRNLAFDHAAWTKTNVTAPTANAHLSPDGTYTSELLTSTSAGGLVESTAAAISGTAGTASLYVRTTSGTQSGTLVLRDTTASADKCTATLVATTTWQRTSCSTTVVSGNSHSIRYYPGGVAGTGSVVAWGAQMEASSQPTSVIVTAGTSVARVADLATVAVPSGLTNASGCVGVTFLVQGFNASLSQRVISFDPAASISPLYLSTTTTAGSYDGTNFGSSPAGAFAGVATRIATGWSGSTTTFYRGGITTTAAYDGSWSIGSVVVLGSGNISSQLYGTLSDVKLGSTTGACQ